MKPNFTKKKIIMREEENITDVLDINEGGERNPIPPVRQNYPPPMGRNSTGHTSSVLGRFRISTLTGMNFSNRFSTATTATAATTGTKRTFEGPTGEQNDLDQEDGMRMPLSAIPQKSEEQLKLKTFDPNYQPSEHGAERKKRKLQQQILTIKVFMVLLVIGIIITALLAAGTI